MGTYDLTFDSFGVRVRIDAGGAAELERVVPLLPPGWERSSSTDVDATFALRRAGHGGHELLRDGRPVFNPEFARHDPQLAFVVLERSLREVVSRMASRFVFVHAGVVAHNGRAIVLPAESYAGKTSLVAALVRAGALYYSDEFAVLDEEGTVHPFAKPLSLRVDGGSQVDQPVEALGGSAGRTPIPVGLVVLTSYRAGAEWAPRELAPGAAVVSVLQHAIEARSRPGHRLRTIRRAVCGALVLEGERPESHLVAGELLAKLTG